MACRVFRTAEWSRRNPPDGFFNHNTYGHTHPAQADNRWIDALTRTPIHVFNLSNQK